MNRDVSLMALSISSGAIDAISFLVLGKVFTAFMTGNIVFLGSARSLADSNYLSEGEVLSQNGPEIPGLFTSVRSVQ